MVACPLRRLDTGLRSALSRYSDHCCQYMGPGCPVRSRVPAATARSYPSSTGISMVRAVAGAADEWAGAGAVLADLVVPELHPATTRHSNRLPATRSISFSIGRVQIRVSPG